MKIALTSATGKLGSAVLNAILDNRLAEPQDLVLCTSSDTSEARFNSFRDRNITIRYHNFDQVDSLERAYAGCSKVFLASTPHISMDYNNAPLWKGREAHHKVAIDAAIKAGVRHIYYTSLAFGNPSKASVMQAHIRTEKYLKEVAEQGKIRYTIIREGLYNESWPLYFGYYFDLKNDKRKEVMVAGNGPISWTAIADMAFGTAKIIVASSSAWNGRTLYLSQNKTWTLEDIARMVSRERGEDILLKIVSRKEYEEFYVARGRDRPAVEWWSSTYDAIKDGECDIKDSTLQVMLLEAGRTAVPLDMTINEVMK